MSKTIKIKHYIVFDSAKLIYNFTTQKEMEDWLILGQKYIDEHNGEIVKCICHKDILGYGIVNVKLKE